MSSIEQTRAAADAAQVLAATAAAFSWSLQEDDNPRAGQFGALARDLRAWAHRIREGTAEEPAEPSSAPGPSRAGLRLVVGGADS